MSKVATIKYSDNETDRFVKEIKTDTNEQWYQSHRGPGKVYEFELLRFMSLNCYGLISPKKK